jgi:uncharacterized protein YdaU (DUF1376 family)
MCQQPDAPLSISTITGTYTVNTRPSNVRQHPASLYVESQINSAPPSKPISFALMPWYPANFMSSTRGWPVTARGIYRELLDAQWEVGGLPVNALELKRLIGATNAEWKHWPTVEPKFPECRDGLRRNPRLEQHREHSIERSKKAAASANQRWKKERHINADE